MTLWSAAKNIYYALVMPAVLFGCNQENEQAYIAAIEVVESASGNTGGSTFSAKARQLRYQTLIKVYLARRNNPKL